MKKNILTLALLLASAGAFAQTEESATSGNLLTGICQRQSFMRAQASTLQNGTDGVGFYATTYRMTLPANTAFMTGGQTLPIDTSSFDHVTDGISSPVDQKEPNGKPVIYDLQGRRVNHMGQHGVYIVNGKKVIR